jgi:23S rRNA pseudouridine1911/1915/1917 synthase
VQKFLKISQVWSMLSVLYEDNHLLAINKASGTLVQGDSTGDKPLVEICKDYIKEKYAKPGDVFLGVVHRLDRPVTGVVVFARTSKSLERMNELFRNRETEKTYWALVNKKPPNESGTLVHWLIKDEKKNKTTAYKQEHPQGQRSELNYKVIAQKSGFFLVEVKPITGRPHQIRVQIASMGCPIVGDVKYGYGAPNEDASICLHAWQLEFIHPVKKEKLTISAKLPKNQFWKPFL